jgi:hypothetical protein
MLNGEIISTQQEIDSIADLSRDNDVVVYNCVFHSTYCGTATNNTVIVEK